jgi:trk system potassium uptake protein
MQHFLVIGLGTLGWQTATGLHSAGAGVLALDRRLEVVNEIQDRVAQAVCVDATDVEAMRAVGAYDLRNAVISLPHHFDAAVLITYSLNKEGFKRIYVRVETEHQAEAIRAVGATNVVFPERDTAHILVRSLMYPSLADEIQLGEDFAFLEVACPPEFDGKSLAELNLRRKHHITLIATKAMATTERAERVHMSPSPDEPLKGSEHLLILGNHKSLAQFKRYVHDQLDADRERQEQLQQQQALAQAKAKAGGADKD